VDCTHRHAVEPGGALFQAPRLQGKPLAYVLFSGLGHNNMGRRFATAVNWVSHAVRADAK